MSEALRGERQRDSDEMECPRVLILAYTSESAKYLDHVVFRVMEEVEKRRTLNPRSFVSASAHLGTVEEVLGEA